MSQKTSATDCSSAAHKRYAARRLIRDKDQLWDALSKEYGFRSEPTVRKHRRSSSFVLQAVRGKGKKKQKIQSSKFQLTFKSEVSAQNIENVVQFGENLLEHMQRNRKRYRGSCEGEQSTRWNSDQQPRTRQRFENLAKRLSVRAAANGVEREAFAETKAYTCFNCIRNIHKKGAISNFIRSLKAKKRQSQNREFADKIPGLCNTFAERIGCRHHH